MPVLPTPLVLLDAEATRDGRIVEVAALRLESGREPVLLVRRVDPGPDWTSSRGQLLTWVHGLGVEDLRGAPSFAEVTGEIVVLCAGATVAAHAAHCDRRYLFGELGRCGLRLRARWLCTLELSRRLLPERRGAGGYSLGALAAAFGVANPAPHSALGDVLTLMQVLSCMLFFCRARTPNLGEVVASCTTSFR